MKKFKNSRLSTDFRKLQTLALNSNGPRVQRGLAIGEHGLGLGVGGTPYDGVSFPGFMYMKGWAFHYVKNRKGRVRLLQP